MIVKLNIKEHWISESWDNEKNVPIRRVMTLDEYMDFQCQVCLEKMGDLEITVKSFPDNETICVCEECGELIILEKLHDKEFNGNLEFTRY